MFAVVRRLLLVLVSVSLVACTTTRVIAQGPDASLAALRASPALGDPRDSVTLVTRDGTRHVIRLQSVDAESVTGTSLDQKQAIAIAASEIERLEVDEFNTRAVVTVGVVVLVVLVAAAMSASRSLARSFSTPTP